MGNGQSTSSGTKVLAKVARGDARAAQQVGLGAVKGLPYLLHRVHCWLCPCNRLYCVRVIRLVNERVQAHAPLLDFDLCLCFTSRSKRPGPAISTLARVVELRWL